MKRQIQKFKLAIKYRHLLGSIKVFYSCGQQFESYIKQTYGE